MNDRRQSILITGASRGIGQAAALRLAADGYEVVVNYRQRDAEAQAVIDAIRADGGQARLLRFDVSDRGAAREAIEADVAANGAYYGVVLSAGVSSDGAFPALGEADWDRVMAVNAKGVFFGCKRAVQQMLTQAPPADGDPEVRGRIVNISSQHGMIRAPEDIAYGVGKAAVVYMTRQIAGDYGGQGIVCNAVAPGKILTGKPPRPNEDELLAYSHARTPWPRLGRPQDVAGAVCFLASDEASYINGENLMVDGGWMAS